MANEDVDGSNASLDRRELALVLGSALLGLAVWWWAIGSAPRHSFGEEQDMGNRLYFPLLLGAAAIGGWIMPAKAGLVGLALGAPGLILSPWTAPRGDNDGLWILIVPMLLAFMFVLALVADVAGRLRGRLTRTP